MKTRSIFTYFSLFIILTLMTACAKSTPTPAALPSTTQEPVAAITQPPTAAPTEDPSSVEPEDANALPPEPQVLTITAADGTALKGYYYPAAVNPAPVVVLMHWAGGDMADWNEVAVWLQNRGQANPFPNPGDMPWWDQTWFPEVPADKSYGVLIFTFRDCLPYMDGCQSMDKAGFLQDAQAALLKARELEGADPARIVAIGSSIGADGAPDGCQLLNEQFPDSCQGSLSLSPGDYLGVSYLATVKKMGESEPPTAAWCLADEGEYFMCQSAEGANNTAFKDFVIPGGSHGNMLLSPDLDPLPMQLILDFLVETLK